MGRFYSGEKGKASDNAVIGTWEHGEAVDRLIRRLASYAIG